MPLVAANFGGTRGRVWCASNGQRRKFEADRPAFGAVHQRVHDIAAGVNLAYRLDQAGGLRRAEPQISGPDLDELTAGPHPGERQRRVEPPGDHQP